MAATLTIRIVYMAIITKVLINTMFHPIPRILPILMVVVVYFTIIITVQFNKNNISHKMKDGLSLILLVKPTLQTDPPLT
jgi:hypothetical protein